VFRLRYLEKLVVHGNVLLVKSNMAGKCVSMRSAFPTLSFRGSNFHLFHPSLANPSVATAKMP